MKSRAKIPTSVGLLRSTAYKTSSAKIYGGEGFARLNHSNCVWSVILLMRRIHETGGSRPALNRSSKAFDVCGRPFQWGSLDLL